MSDAKIYREKAALFIDIANAASDEQVRATLVRLARSALRTATDMESLQTWAVRPPGQIAIK
jgi:hypothetical protein